VGTTPEETSLEVTVIDDQWWCCHDVLFLLLLP